MKKLGGEETAMAAAQLVLQVLVFLLLAAATATSNSDEQLKLKLIHVFHSHDSPLHNRSLSSAQTIHKLIAMDQARLRFLDRQRNTTSQPAFIASSSSSSPASWAESPMESGAFLGLGQYLVSISFGTPPQNLLLIADTGSDLIWLQCSTSSLSCSPRRQHCNRNNNRKWMFITSRSSTLSPIPCTSPQCLLVPAPPHAPSCNLGAPSPCSYAYDYADGSSTAGFLVCDTATIANGSTFSASVPKSRSASAAVQNVVFGCGMKNQGRSFAGTGGILGLGQGQLSFAAQAGSIFSNTFSYCLLDFQKERDPGRRKNRKSSSFLFMGKSSSSSQPYFFAHTPLITNPLAPTFYYVAVLGIRVANRPLPIPASEWAIDVLGNGGTVIDSGSTLSYLRLAPYLHLINAFIAAVHLTRIPSSANLFQGLELCYNASSNQGFPRLTIDFAQGLSLELPTDNYLVDVADGVKCLAIRPTLSPFAFNVLGNLMQQGYHVEFDKGNSRIGFARTECAD